MNFDCSIKNTDNWKRLVNEVGENNAYFHYIINDGKIDLNEDITNDLELKAILPMSVSVKSFIRKVDGNNLILAQYQNHAISLSNYASNFEKFHEAFHAIFDIALNEEERDYYLSLAEQLISEKEFNDRYSFVKEQYLNSDDIELKKIALEEFLADRYALHRREKENVSKGLFGGLIYKIKSFIKFLLNRKSVESLFYKIDSGVFKKVNNNNDSTSIRYMQLRGQPNIDIAPKGKVLSLDETDFVFKRILAHSIKLSNLNNDLNYSSVKLTNKKDIVKKAINDFKVYFREINNKEVKSVSEQEDLAHLSAYFFLKGGLNSKGKLNHAEIQLNMLLLEALLYLKRTGIVNELLYGIDGEDEVLRIIESVNDTNNELAEKLKTIISLENEGKDNDEEITDEPEDTENDFNILERQHGVAIDGRHFYSSLDSKIKEFLSGIVYDEADYYNYFKNSKEELTLFVDEKKGIYISKSRILDYQTLYKSLIKLFNNEQNFIKNLLKLKALKTSDFGEDLVGVSNLETKIFADYFFKTLNIDERALENGIIQGKDGNPLKDEHIDFLNLFFKALQKDKNTEYELKTKRTKVTILGEDEQTIKATMVLVESNSNNVTSKQIKYWYDKYEEFKNEKLIELAKENLGEDAFIKFLENDGMKVADTVHKIFVKFKDDVSMENLNESSKNAQKQLRDIGIFLDLNYIKLSILDFLMSTTKITIEEKVDNEIVKTTTDVKTAYKKNKKRDTILGRFVSIKEGKRDEYKKVFDFYFNNFNIEGTYFKKANIVDLIKNSYTKSADSKGNIINSLKNLFNVYEQNSVKKVLKKMAEGNLAFDEAVQDTVFRNPENKLKNGIQDLTYISSFFNFINDRISRILFFADGIRDIEAVFETKDEIPTVIQTDSIDSQFVTENFLVKEQDGKQTKFVDMLNNSRLIYKTVGGFDSNVANINALSVRKSFGNSNGNELFITLLSIMLNMDNLDSNNGLNLNSLKTDENNFKLLTTNNTINMAVPLKMLESSNTMVFVELLYIHNIGNNLIVDYIELEFKRIQKTIQDINNNNLSYEIDMYHTGLKNGTTFSLAVELFINDELRKELLKLAEIDGAVLDDNIKKRISNSVDEHFRDDISFIIEKLTDIGVLDNSNNVVGAFRTIFLETLLHRGKDSNFAQLSDFLKNYAANSLWFNALMHGDHALQYAKKYPELLKRSKGDNGSTRLSNTDLVLEYAKIALTEIKFKVGDEVHSIEISFDKERIRSYSYVVIKDRKIPIQKPTVNLREEGEYIDNRKDIKDPVDAQIWESLLHRHQFLVGSGRSNRKISEVLIRLIKGEKIDVNSLFKNDSALKSDSTFLNAIKLLGFDSKMYQKGTTFVLSLDLVGVKNLDGVWLLLAGKEEYFNMLIYMLKNMNDLVMPESASKKFNVNIQSIDNINKLERAYKSYSASKRFGIQTEIVAGKEAITFFTQMAHIIDTEHNTDAMAFGRLVSEVISDYQNAESNLFSNSFIKKFGEIFEEYTELNGEEVKSSNYSNLLSLTELKDLKVSMRKFLEKSINTLNDQDGNKKLIKILSQKQEDVLLSIDNLFVFDKILEFFHAHFNNGGFSQKVNGRAFIINSSHNMHYPKIAMNVLDADGNIVGRKWEVIRKGMILPLTVKNGKVIYDISAEERDVDLFLAENRSLLRNLAKESNHVFHTDEDISENEVFLDRLRYNVESYDENGKVNGRYSEMVASANTKQLYNLDKKTFTLSVLTGFGTRIPSQDKVSAKSLKYVDFLDLMYGDCAFFLDEVTFLDGGDHDGDKVFCFFKTYDGDFNEYEDTFESYLKFANKKYYKNKAKDIDDLIDKLKKDNLIYTEEQFNEYVKAGRNPNDYYLTNKLVDSMQKLLTYDEVHRDKFTLSEEDKIIDVEDKIIDEMFDKFSKYGLSKDEIAKIVESGFNVSKIKYGNYTASYLFNGLFDKVVGADNIGIAVKANLCFTYLFKNNAKINEESKSIKILSISFGDGKVLKLNNFKNVYSTDFYKNKENIMDVVSAIISIAVDEAKNKRNAHLGFTKKVLNFVELLLHLGVPKEYIIMMIKTEHIKTYFNSLEEKDGFTIKNRTMSLLAELTEYITKIKELSYKGSSKLLSMDDLELVYFESRLKETYNEKEAELIFNKILTDRNIELKNYNNRKYDVYKKLSNLISFTGKLNTEIYQLLGNILALNKGTGTDEESLENLENAIEILREQDIVDLLDLLDDSSVKEKGYKNLMINSRIKAYYKLVKAFGKLSYTRSYKFKDILNNVKKYSNLYSFSKTKKSLVAQVNTNLIFSLLTNNNFTFAKGDISQDLIIDGFDKNICEIMSYLNKIYKAKYDKEADVLISLGKLLFEEKESFIENKIKKNLLLSSIKVSLSIFLSTKTINSKANFLNTLRFDNMSKRSAKEKQDLDDELFYLYHNTDTYPGIYDGTTKDIVQSLFNYLLLRHGFNFSNNNFYEYLLYELDNYFKDVKTLLNVYLNSSSKDDYFYLLDMMENYLALNKKHLFEKINELFDRQDENGIEDDVKDFIDSVLFNKSFNEKISGIEDLIMKNNKNNSLYKELLKIFKVISSLADNVISVILDLESAKAKDKNEDDEDVTDNKKEKPNPPFYFKYENKYYKLKTYTDDNVFYYERLEMFDILELAYETGLFDFENDYLERMTKSKLMNLDSNYANSNNKASGEVSLSNYSEINSEANLNELTNFINELSSVLIENISNSEVIDLINKYIEKAGVTGLSQYEFEKIKDEFYKELKNKNCN